MPKTLHYKFSTTPSLTGSDHPVGTSPNLSITRATTAWAKDSDGWLREYQDGEARFPGASFSHNLLPVSDDLTDAAWTKTSVTNETSAESISGISLFKSTAGAATTVRFYDVVGIEKAEVQYLVSAYVKAGTGVTHVALSADNSSGGGVFEFSSGTFTTDTSDYSYVEDLGGGYYRIGVVLTGTAADTSRNIFFWLSNRNNYTASPAFAGTEFCYIGGVQVEDVSGAWDSDNEVKQSQDFSTTWSIPGNDTVTTDNATAPDDTTTADTWNLLANNEQHRFTQAVTIGDGSDYHVYSVYAKADSHQWLMLRLYDGTSFYSATFDLQNGVTGSAETGTILWKTCQAAANGYYRCAFAVRGVNSNAFTQAAIFAQSSDSSTAQTWTPTATTIDIWGAQVETKKPNQVVPGTYAATTTAEVRNYSPSTYIATTTAAVSSFSGANDGLLVEEARTNICKQSEDFSTTWTLTRAAVNTDQTIAPDGSLTADQLIDNDTGTTSAYLNQAVTVANSTAYTASVFAKADQLSKFWIQAAAFTTPADSEAWFDLSAGTVGTVDAGFDDSGIEDYGNGWYRCWASFTTDATDTAGVIRIGPAESDGSTSVTHDGTSSIFLWGVQLEAGGFLTSYIPTTTGTVTRNADSILTTTVDWYGSDGSWYVEAQQDYDWPSGVPPIIAIDNGGSSNRISAAADVAQGFDVSHNTQVGSDGSISGTGNFSLGVAFKGVFAYANNDMVSYIDGSQIGTDVTVTVPVSGTLTTFRAGSSHVPAYWGSLIKEIAYWDERLDNATLADYSTNGIPAASLTGIRYPRDSMPTGEQRFQDFIDASGITKSNELIDDYKAALASLTGLDPDLYSIDDLFKIYWESL